MLYSRSVISVAGRCREVTGSCETETWRAAADAVIGATMCSGYRWEI